jgi:hypothetical protein
MLKGWENDEDKIKALKRGVRKDRTQGPKYPELEKRLVASFEEARALGRTINRRWFKRKAFVIYEDLFPQRVIKEAGKLNKYLGFTASTGWFQSFRRRTGVALRQPTKKAQSVSLETCLILCGIY